MLNTILIIVTAIICVIESILGISIMRDIYKETKDAKVFTMTEREW